MHPPPSSAKPPGTGKCGFFIFPIGSLLNICIYVYYVIGVFVVCVCFVLCRKKEEGETGVVIE